LEVSPDRLALVLSYDASGFDLIAGQSGGTSTMTVIAVGGILAAIALPAYQDYIARAQVAESIAMAGAAKIAVAEHYFSTEELPESLAEIGVDGELRYGELTWEDGLLLIRFSDSEPTTARLRGQIVAIGLKSDGSWLCGYAQDRSESAVPVGNAPAQMTTLPEKMLPSSCR
jgi:type IV pilus assembly protein PilA